jgi:hypothetical protein
MPLTVERSHHLTGTDKVVLAIFHLETQTELKSWSKLGGPKFGFCGGSLEDELCGQKQF